MFNSLFDSLFWFKLSEILFNMSRPGVIFIILLVFHKKIAALLDRVQSFKWIGFAESPQSTTLIQAATPQEKEEEKKEEMKEEAEIAISPDKKDHEAAARKQKFDSYRKVESFVSNEVQFTINECLKSTPLMYAREQKIASPYWTFVIDWILYREESHKRAVLWVEVVVSENIEYTIRRKIERLRYYKLDFPTMLIFSYAWKAISEKDKDLIDSLLRTYNEDIILVVSQLNANNKLEFLGERSIWEVIKRFSYEIREWDLVRHKVFGIWKVVENWRDISIVRFNDERFWARKVRNALLEQI